MSKIPEDAKKVYDGIRFQVYQKEVEQFDGSYKTFERCKSYDVAKAICIIDDKILVSHEKQPGFSKIVLPGGIIEEGEDPYIALQREILEETGYEFANTDKLCELEHHTGAWATRYYYICRDVVHMQDPKHDLGEQISIQHISFGEYINYICDTIDPLHYRIMRTYIIPNKLQEFRKLLGV